ncbi:hypothetical protein Lal_00038380 [Lupinus albus]|nr:hypothetical protein Lal_00038380 [Lupinus albus]
MTKVQPRTRTIHDLSCFIISKSSFMCSCESTKPKPSWFLTNMVVVTTIDSVSSTESLPPPRLLRDFLYLQQHSIPNTQFVSDSHSVSLTNH